MRKLNLSTLLTIIVAIATVVVMYLQYRDGHYFYSKDINNASSYTIYVKTFDKNKIPKDIYEILSDDFLKQKKNIENTFEVTHFSGKSLKNIKINIKSKSKIEKIVLKNGEIGSNIKFSKDRKSALIEKKEIIPDSSISGSIITSGLEKVELSVYSDNGNHVKIKEDENKKIEKKEKSLIVTYIDAIKVIFSLLFLVAMPYLLYKSITYESYKYDYNNNYTYYLYLGLAISTDWGSILVNMFFAHALYFLSTREAVITAALEEAAGSVEKIL